MSEIDRQEPDSAKQRSRRIRLDYYKKLNGVERVKWGITVLVSVAAGAYVAWTLGGWAMGSEAAARQFSPGPVAAAHGAWEGKCSTCHENAVALRSDSRGVGELFGGAEKSDEACKTCHLGPPHHPVTQDYKHLERNCAGCHIDHRGEDADLTRVEDSACTSCHKLDIKTIEKLDKNAKPSTLLRVTQFGASPLHPPFRSIESDPGNIRFNHMLHMMPNQYPKGAKQKKWENREPPVPQLQCANCHTLDDAQARVDGKPATSVPGGGGYMQPINYDKHCSICHKDELHLEGDIQGVIPHSSTPATIRAILTQRSAKKVEPLPLTLAPPPKAPPTPGKTPNQNDAQTMSKSQWEKIRKAEEILQNVPRPKKASHCAMCHEFGQQPTEGDKLMPDVLPASIPAVWLSHAKFDHAAHRGVSCLECHAETQNGINRLDNDKVHIPKIEKCLECHAPEAKHGGTGARFDCAECHRYHGGELYPHGKGADVRALKNRRAATEFIEGARSNPPDK